MSVAEKHYCLNATGRIICAVTWDDNKNTCGGDSGGPLACQENDKKWYLRGVNSYGEDNCKFWTAFTLVSSFHDWIKYKIERK